MNRIFVCLMTLSCLLTSWPLWADDDVTRIKESDLTESSGLAASNVKPDRWWTHNDSGDKARLFAFSTSGKSTGECRLKNVDARDWEDMASFVDGDTPRLIVADCGDNNAKHKSIKLYLFDEPNPNRSDTIKDFQTLQVTYDDGPRNCEAVAVDVRRRKIILIEKALIPYAGIYELDLPSAEQKDQKVVAKRIGSLTIPIVTAMDLDQSNGDVWIVNYIQAFRFPRASKDQTLLQQLRILPDPIEIPKWKLIEAIAVDTGHKAWITSEGESAPFGSLKLSK